MSENSNQAADRGKIIIRTSITGILANVFLAAFKAVVGILSNSIAIVLDAVNNLSDAASSLITIIGTRLAGRENDRKHPFGYGRIEYLSALLISVIVLYAGATSLIESIKKIFDPQTPEYSTASLVIVSVAIIVKIVLGLYVKKTGIRVNSDSLVNSGKDALLDSVISASTLIAALIFIFTGFSTEAYLGALISAVIIKSGIEMLSETVSRLLGESADPKLVQDIKATIRSFDEVNGAYDLILHNYGPDIYNGSVHIEIEDTLSVERLDSLTREITSKVHREHKVLLTGIGIYSVNTHDREVIDLREKIRSIVMSHDFVKGMHGFYYSPTDKLIRFDVVISFDAKVRSLVLKDIKEDLSKHYPDMNFVLAMDMDFGEL
ncbi:MAG: cation transporter [Clostridiales bacterium]|nr:cation transporter [Clostridiales bacterium]